MVSSLLRVGGLRAAAAATCRPTVAAAPQRHMATLRDIQTRLKSITNIEKITASMKMIASTKLARAQRNMESGRVFGSSVNLMFDKYASIPAPNDPSSHLYLICSSDKGLCGAIHSNVSKATKRALTAHEEAYPSGSRSVTIIGDKCKAQMQRDRSAVIDQTWAGIGKQAPTWTEAATVWQQVPEAAQEGEGAVTVTYNRFKSVISYDTTLMPVLTKAAITEAWNAGTLSTYDTENDELLANFYEFYTTSLLFWCMIETHASEMAARRQAMENASTNAGEMIAKLQMTYNRTRQAVITNELIDIIVGASAM